MTTFANKQVTLQVNENIANASDLDDTGIIIESSEPWLSNTDFDKDTTTQAKKKQKKESKPKLRDMVNEVYKNMITAGHGQVSTNLNSVEGDKAPYDGKVLESPEWQYASFFIVMTHGFNFNANPWCYYLVLF